MHDRPIRPLDVARLAQSRDMRGVQSRGRDCDHSAETGTAADHSRIAGDAAQRPVGVDAPAEPDRAGTWRDPLRAGRLAVPVAGPDRRIARADRPDYGVSRSGDSAGGDRRTLCRVSADVVRRASANYAPAAGADAGRGGQPATPVAPGGATAGDSGHSAVSEFSVRGAASRGEPPAGVPLAILF